MARETIIFSTPNFQILVGQNFNVLIERGTDFIVNEARMVARKIPNAELVAPQTIGAASNFKPLDSAYDRNLARIQCASHKASVSGPVPMPSSDQTSPPIGNAQMMSPVSTATANSMKGTMNQNTPFDGSTTAYAPVNQASQRHLFASVQSSPSILAAPKIRPVSNPSNESTHLRPGYAISYPAVPDFLATCNLQKESNITTKEPNTIDQVSNRGHLRYVDTHVGDVFVITLCTVKEHLAICHSILIHLTDRLVLPQPVARILRGLTVKFKTLSFLSQTPHST